MNNDRDAGGATMMRMEMGTGGTMKMWKGMGDCEDGEDDDGDGMRPDRMGKGRWP